MKKRFYAVMAAVLAVSAAFAGCGKTSGGVQTAKTWEYTVATEIKYDCFGGDGTVMPVLGFWSAPRSAMLNGQYFPEMKNDEYFSAVKEAGVNLLIQANDDAYYYEDTVELTLDFCDKYGLGYFVTDTNLFALSNAGGSVPGSAETIKRAFAKYAEHKSFAGMYLIDEPNIGTEAGVRGACNNFYRAAEELSLNIHPYVNLYPYWPSMFKSDLSVYAKHLNDILKDNPIKGIAYDIYPLKNDGFDYVWYFTNLSLVKKAADEKRIAWLPFVSVSGESKYNLPDEGQLSWQVNEYLAFGAKGIYYFPINSPISFSDYVEDGATVAMFDYFGNKTEVYYYVRQVNKQIQAVDEYLMKATNHGVVLNGELAAASALTNGEVIESGSFRELRSVSGDRATVGCFDYYGKTCLYVVNNEMERDASVSLGFDARYEYKVIQRGESAGVKGSKIQLNLAAGESAFILIK